MTIMCHSWFRQSIRPRPELVVFLVGGALGACSVLRCFRGIRFWRLPPVTWDVVKKCGQSVSKLRRARRRSWSSRVFLIYIFKTRIYHHVVKTIVNHPQFHHKWIYYCFTNINHLSFPEGTTFVQFPPSTARYPTSAHTVSATSLGSRHCRVRDVLPAVRGSWCISPLAWGWKKTSCTSK